MSSKLIIGIGNKAQHGKDTFAGIAAKQFDDYYITHWADPLKEEVTNAERTAPLIYATSSDNGVHYMLLDHADGTSNTYLIKHYSEVPYLHEIFTKRNITVYWGMDGKDSEMLQFWGTDFRREMCDEDYWVNKTLLYVKYRPEKVILIPDTRFKNEWEAIKANQGLYVHVLRLNEDGTIYQDPSRSPTHKSEVDLDAVGSNYSIVAVSGDLHSFEMQALEVIEKIKETV